MILVQKLDDFGTKTGNNMFCALVTIIYSKININGMRFGFLCVIH